MGAVIKLEDFGGMVPRLSSRLLPPNMATVARNTKLLNGEARGFRTPRILTDLSDESFTVLRAFRLQYPELYDLYGATDEFWLSFDSRDVDVVRSPIINDLYDRYYWAGDGRPMYNTRNRIVAGSDPFYLGVPRPDNAPTVTPPAGSNVTRAYVYTFVSAYGEESQPSEPTLATGTSGSWTISALDTTVNQSAFRNVTRKRIYRTVPGNNSSLFFFVTEINLAESSHIDLQADDDVAANNTLESTDWGEPVTDMEGFVVMPNGYLVGWAGRRLLFSEPYRPHAWPASYELSTEYEIVGLAVWGSTLVIGTKSQPYIGQGTTPSAFVMQKMDAVEPCLSRRGMVATVAGAYYPSINGLALLNTNGVQIITKDILTKEEWAEYSPSNIFAAQLGMQYIAFNSTSVGFIFNPTEPKTKLVELDAFVDIVGIETDKYTGNVNLIRADRVYDWDPEGAERLFWRWKSKDFHLPKPVNFGAVKIKFSTVLDDLNEEDLADYVAFNQTRFDGGTLNTLNGHMINGVETLYDVYEDPQVLTFPQWMMPLGGNPLFSLDIISAQVPAVRFIAYIDAGTGLGKQVVFDSVTYDETIMRLPTGFKRDLWQFEIVSNADVYSVTIAETGKDLGRA